ncbi:unnamed protein product [Cuscuta epithymum]|uniref:Ubiquitin-like protease family profile domain-containing protein n=1 Tax=Cuscuta epithymum TaxID=186058 RepID=A0AAV0FLF9_9ASTE|nr:unnamed protein product [Cuscuta epithymum]
MDYHQVYALMGEEPMGERFLEVEPVEECPQQDDGGNCGMYMLKIAEFLMIGMDMDAIYPEAIPFFRQKMATELILYSERRQCQKE